MGLKIRTLSLVAGVALVAGATVSGTAGASTPLPNAAGTIHCLVKGTLKFNPPLLGYTGHPVNSTTVTLVTTETGCSGTGDATNITGGSSKNSHVSDTNDCATVLTAAFEVSQGALTWKVPTGTQKWAPSTIQFTSGSKSGDGVSTPFTTDTSGSSIGGSFNGDIANAHAQIKQNLAYIVSKCNNSDPLKGGLKSLTIIAPQSTFDLS
jgi:hypothetical protein